jgi:hypothetical protein
MAKKTLKEKIELKILESDGDSEVAAINICLLLEDEIGLAGNGWFDNDQEFLNILSKQ